MSTKVYIYNARFLIDGKWRFGSLESKTKLRTNRLYIINGVQTVPISLDRTVYFDHDYTKEGGNQMTLRDVLEKMSCFQDVSVHYGCDHKSGTAAELLNNLGSDWLESPVIEIKADRFSELLVEVGD